MPLTCKTAVAAALSGFLVAPPHAVAADTLMTRHTAFAIEVVEGLTAFSPEATTAAMMTRLRNGTSEKSRAAGDPALPAIADQTAARLRLADADMVNAFASSFSDGELRLIRALTENADGRRIAMRVLEIAEAHGQAQAVANLSAAAALQAAIATADAKTQAARAAAKTPPPDTVPQGTPPAPEPKKDHE